MHGTGSLFSSFVSALGEGVRSEIVAYPPEQVLNSKQLEIYVRERLPVNETFVLLAESFSGPIALSIAAEAPPHLRGVILCCSFAKNPRPALALLKPILSLPIAVKPIAAASLFLLGSYATPLLRQQLKEELAQVPSMALRNRLSEVIDIDVTASMFRISVPILYLRANRDRLVPKSAMTDIVASAPQARVMCLDGPHMLLQAAPMAVANVVKVFLETVR